MTLLDAQHKKKRRVQYNKQRIVFFAVISAFAIILIVTYCKPSSLSQVHVPVPAKRNNIQTQTQSKRNDDRPDEFCKEIIRDPQPWNKYCKTDYSTMRCRNDSVTYRMYGEDMQDWYFYTQHFINLKRPGFYLDIATNDPIHKSNTFFLDRCMKWKGICIEANQDYIGRIKKYRSCDVVPTCVSKDDGTIVTFGKLKEAGGIVDDNFVSKEKLAGSSDAVEQMRCTNVKTILSKNGPRVIDYLSLDIEGHELMVLKGVDWTKTIINVMSIETYRDKNIEKSITDFMEPFGYRVHTIEKSERFSAGRLWRDLTLVHKDVEFGKPV